MQGKDLVAEVLKREGTEILVGFPDNPLFEAGAVRDIRPIITRSERVAVNIAEGYARVTAGARPAVVAVQYGPGIENASGAIAQAYSDSAPVLVLPGGYPRDRLGVPPNFVASRNLAGITKWAETVLSAGQVPQMLRRAFTLLRNGKPGPVVLEMPTDVMTAEVPGDGLDYEAPRPSRPWADPAEVRELVDALLRARSPVIWAGQGVLYAQATAELVELAELLQVPVMTSQNGKSAFPEDHPLALGAGGRSYPATVTHFLKKADFVLGIGTSFTRSAYTAPIPPGKVLAQVTNCEADINKDYPISYGAIGDARAVLRQMIEEVKARLGPQGRRGDTSVVREVQAVREKFLEEWMPLLTSDEEPLNPYRVIWDLMHTVDPRRTIATHDAGMPREEMTAFWVAPEPLSYLGWGKTTQLGTGLGLAMGARLARPDRLCLNVMGDAAFGMVGMDFETAVRCRIPILTVVLNNGLMGGYGPRLPVATEKYGARYLSGDFHKVAEGLGGYTERVERVRDLVPAIRRCVAEVQAGRPALLEVITREETRYPAGL